MFSKNSLLITLFFLTSHICICQNNNRDFIEKWVKSNAPALNWSKLTFYIIDGSPYQLIQADSILNKWLPSKISDFFFISLYIKDSNVYPEKNDPEAWAIGINSKSQMKLNSIKTKFEKARQLLYSDSITNIPALYINDVLQDRKALTSIKKNKIYYIDIIDSKTTNSFYSQYIKSGLIRIWTKKLE